MLLSLEKRVLNHGRGWRKKGKGYQTQRWVAHYALCSTSQRRQMLWPQRREAWALSFLSPLELATKWSCMPLSTARSFQVLKTTNSCLFQMGVNCLLWDEYSFHLHLPRGPHNQPKRNTEMLCIQSLLHKKQ